MKSAIIYYSYSGNTRKVANILAEHLRHKGEATVIELEALDESKSFLGQCQKALRRVRANIAPANFDLSSYDLICFGTPVWAFGPAPAMNTYLDNCLGVADKQIILFTTYGSGIGNKRCLNYIESILASKGAKNFKRFSIQQGKVNDSEFVKNVLKKLL